MKNSSTCAQCGAVVENDLGFCSHCRVRLAKSAGRGCLIFVALFILGAMVMLFGTVGAFLIWGGVWDYSNSKISAENSITLILLGLFFQIVAILCCYGSRRLSR